MLIHGQASPAYAVPTNVCSDDDGSRLTDGYGNQYLIGCASDLSGSSQGATGVNVYSFNDCAYHCSRDPPVPGLPSNGQPCTGVTYSGGTNGVGGGTCYFRTDKSLNFVYNGNSGLVGLIRVQNYALYQTTTTTTTTSVRTPASLLYGCYCFAAFRVQLLVTLTIAYTGSYTDGYAVDSRLRRIYRRPQPVQPR